MPRTMRDSTTAADIPLGDLQLVAGYANGRFAWSPADWARFGSIPKVRIDVLGNEPASASVLDVENGDATPPEAVGWVNARRKLFPGTVPTIYCNRSTSSVVAAAMLTAGLRLSHEYTFWIATLDGTKVLPNMVGIVAVQFEEVKPPQGHYDESVVYDDEWHPSAPPAPPVDAWKKQALIAAQTMQTASTTLVRLLEANQ